MTTTPTGAPVWERTNDHTTYGGHLQKENYQGQGAINAKTDVTAQQFARLCADVEALGKVADFATITYTQDDTGTADPTVDSYDAMAGARAPTATRESDGVVLLTWEDSYEDAYGIAGDINIGHVHADLEGTAAGGCTWTRHDTTANGSYNAVRIRCWDAAGAAALDKTVTVTISTTVG